MDKMLAAERTRMYRIIREAHPLYFGDPLKFYSSGIAHTEDPFGGPAAREFNGSGGGFVGAAIGIGAAILTGGASLGFTTIAQGLSTIALVTGVVGAVTGNKVFGTISALAGLGSGFMTLAGSGTFGTEMQQWAKSDFMGTPGYQAPSIGQNLSATATTGTDIAQITPPADTGTGILNAQSNAADMGSLNLATPDFASQAMGNPDLATGQLSPTGADGISPMARQAASTGSVPDISATPDAAVISQVEKNVAAEGAGVNDQNWRGDENVGKNVQGATKSVTPAPETGADWFAKMSTFVKENKDIINAAGTTGNFIAGLLKPDLTDAQRSFLEAKTNQVNTETANAQSTAANANAVPDVAAMFSVNSSVSPFKGTPATAAGTRPAGLIQTRRTA